jgi:hypothetical protein
MWKAIVMAIVATYSTAPAKRQRPAASSRSPSAPTASVALAPPAASSPTITNGGPATRLTACMTAMPRSAGTRRSAGITNVEKPK